MSIPSECTALVMGGGPGGSYAASLLAREGIDTVLLEADKFPRYHIGESMLASMRHFLRLVDLDTKFDNYGFTKKVGAAFKLNGTRKEGYTDFLAAGGKDNYAWNVIRSEADDIMFRHAGECGAKVFDGVKVVKLHFDSQGRGEYDSSENFGTPNPGRPIYASWYRKANGASGTINFDYVIDATGRAGLVSTEYYKNRRFNLSLKNTASWGYWGNTGAYAAGTSRANSPFFEALTDESGWAWLIPLHDGTTSVGVVMNQEKATTKKRACSPTPTSQEFYHASLQLAPNLMNLIGDGKLVTDIKQASDYSYSASSYSSPYLRLVGDAGCFIDPYFSSGVHLALSSALSAAVTISASIQGLDEAVAAKWHSTKVADSYTRFLLVVLSAYKQIRRQEEPILSDFNEDNFDRAFGLFRPIIQGSADIGSKLTQNELNKTLEFCTNAFTPTLPEERHAVVQKMLNCSKSDDDIQLVQAECEKAIPSANKEDETLDGMFSAEEIRVINSVKARQIMRTQDTIDIHSFGTDIIDGYRPRLERGRLGLVRQVM